jgi:alkylated DNA nucleotide flippase Atl1
MDVHESPLRRVLDGKTRYLIPLYQRPYSWKHASLKQLWDDLIDLARRRQDTPGAMHFTGSLVLSAASVTPGMTSFIVVDGQQRLTTLSVLLVSLRDYWARNGDDERRTELHEDYLTNRFASEDARWKLLPTQADRSTYLTMLAGRPLDNPDSLLDDAHRFFERQIALLGPDDPDVAAVQDAVLDGLAFVTITTHDSDNVYRIFESLNNTGVPLTQADLVRNLVFMQLGDDSDHVYESAWLPLQKGLSSRDLESLFWFDLAWQDHEIRQSDTYDQQKKRIVVMGRADLIAFVHHMERVARSLRLMRNPALEINAAVRVALEHFVEWDSSVTDPLVLRLLDRRANGSATDEQTARALSVLESYLVRRFLIGATGAGLNRTLGQAATELPEGEDPADALRRFLSTGKKRYAADEEVRQAVLRTPFYKSGKAHQRRAILRWLQALHPSKEQAKLDRMSIEHVLPQTLTPQWIEDFEQSLTEEEDFDSEYETLVHTLGNLTFTNYNPELSNRPFAQKRELLAKSSLPGNHDIAARETWGAPEIRERGSQLAALIVSHWAPPIPGLGESKGGVDWALMKSIVESIPPGYWTAYADLGLVVGAHPISVGQHLGTHYMEGAWRVMKGSGQVVKDFHWTLGSPHEGKDPIAVLTSEGLSFDSKGRADPLRKLHTTRLLALAGLDTELNGGEDENEPDVGTDQAAPAS